jgi:hypothetical protein
MELPLIIGLLGLVLFFANPDDPNTSWNAVGILRITPLLATTFSGLGWAILGSIVWSDRVDSPIQSKAMAGRATPGQASQKITPIEVLTTRCHVV